MKMKPETLGNIRDIEPFSCAGIYGIITEREPYGGPQLSRQSKSLTAKANHSQQKQINSMRYFYPAEYTNLVWSLFIFIGNVTVCRRIGARRRL